ncbi:MULTISPECIES: plastocyanin/azurin family copper-binding protein [Halomicrobium]|uniref:plastocyanin/azurin family copper-binding protein n=1 Tax=Halomicrobium TaxID=203135 RepID=UPI0009AE359F|nr:MULTISPECIES: plastocyanin/azurin family copper-binding protein [Halomicrobium]
MTTANRSRRTFLARAGAVLGTGVLGGCLSDSRDRTIAVGPGHRTVFEPEAVTVPSGATITWVLKSDNHNVVPATVPAGSDWEGTPGRPSITYGSGYSYETTFTISGTYDYFCQPHVDAGMTGSVVVE